MYKFPLHANHNAAILSMRFNRDRTTDYGIIYAKPIRVHVPFDLLPLIAKMKKHWEFSNSKCLQWIFYTAYIKDDPFLNACTSKEVWSILCVAYKISLTLSRRLQRAGYSSSGLGEWPIGAAEVFLARLPRQRKLDS